MAPGTMERVGASLPRLPETSDPPAREGLSPGAVATAVVAVLAFGLLGALAMAGPFRRSRRRRAARCAVCRRHQRAWVVVTAAVAVLTLAGAGLRLAQGQLTLPTCAVTSISGMAPLGEAQRGGDTGVAASARAVLTAPASGLAIGYSRWRGQTLCDVGRPQMTLAFMPGALSTGGSTIGDVFVTPLRTDLNRRETEALARHEARHSDQWAVATLIGGMTLLPVAYLFDNSLYPRSLNHFEQSAGLAAGGYPDAPSPPPGPRPWALAAWALVAGLLLRPRLRQLLRMLTGRRASSPPSPSSPSSPQWCSLHAQ